MDETKIETEAGGWEEKAREAPARPGVYLFKDRAGEVLYVGKAKNLRVRVRAYRKDEGDGRRHIQFLRARIAGLDFIITDTEKEALILENNLIKKHQPHYNIMLRDDKTYYHLRLTLTEPYPRLLLARRPKKGGKDLLFGPYSGGAAVKDTIRLLQEIFPLRRCPGKVYRRRARPCLNHQIGKCLGPCAAEVGPEEYRRMVEEVVRFLKGKKPELIAELKTRMAEAAAAERFELAATLRDRVWAIEKTLEPQKVDSVRPVSRDAIGFARQGDRAVIHRLGYRGGALLISESRSFARTPLPDEEVLGSFLGQRYADAADAPAEVLIPFEPADAELLRAALADVAGRALVLRVPVRGEGRELVELATQNATAAVTREAKRGDDRERAVAELGARLRLPRPPRWIECVDISIHAGEAPVGSVVKFQDGEPDKTGYRRYRIRTVEGMNDYEMMREVLSRRLGRARDEGGPLPDLLVVDGGKGQLGVARAVLQDLGLADLPLAALAKDRELGDPKGDAIIKKGERLFVPGVKDPIKIKPGAAALHLLDRVRDEAHRFAISYHQLLRGKKTRRSSLEAIPGIGPQKARALLKRFRGLAGLRQAPVADLAATPGLSEKDAQAVKTFLEKG